MHAFPESSNCAAKSPCRNDFFESFLLAWFDHFLKGRDTGVLEAPKVQLQADDGVWRHEETWPPAVKETAVHPQTDGRLLLTAGQGKSGYRDAGPNHYGDGNTGSSVPLPQLPGSSVEFVSDPLTSPLRLTGLPRFTTVATADGRRANLVITLLERKADGSQRYLNFGALNLNHAASLEKGEADITGKALEAAVRMYPQDNIVATGSRLVLHLGGDVETDRTVSGNDANFLNYGMNILPVTVGANVILDLARTTLVLPVNAGDRIEKLSWVKP